MVKKNDTKKRQMQCCYHQLEEIRVMSVNRMQQIIGSTKMENGIVVFWLEGDARKWDSFNFQELIDMNINTMNLLDRPTMYQIDPAGHKLTQKK